MDSKIVQAIKRVEDHGHFILGPEVFELESQLAEFVGSEHCVTCASGTDALKMSLMAYDIGPGDKVITTPFTFVATVEAIVAVGATPVFVDIDDKTFNMDVEKIDYTNFKAILPVNLFGHPCDYRTLWSANHFNNRIIEDACQSFGAENLCTSPNLGDIGCTSFFPTKPLGCYGDGGACFTNNGNVAEMLVSLRSHGRGKDKYVAERIGMNSRLDTIQAAVLLEKLKTFPEDLERRAECAARYAHELRNLPGVILPTVAEGCTSSWAQYPVLIEEGCERESMRSFAHFATGANTAIHYPVPIHLQPAYKFLGYRQGDFPVAESVAKRIFSLEIRI